ncbi:AsmA-like C-terminal domain-containing protein [Pararhodospirillum photometricum]|uniref:AsmA-like C-terminal domain-containing protein n=1 Tax=Pararhodospirillum photometricum TaxID=1084 RepID=UPI0003136A85|nr:AsmA-like C-terminal domain-containing protein [Pararhodospirillum photometricum]
MTLDRRGMDVKGTATLGGVPASLEWREAFSGDGVLSRYHARATVTEAQRQALGIVLPATQPPLATGDFKADVTVVREAGDRTTLDARLDLSPQALSLAALDWYKAPGASASARLLGRFTPGRATVDVNLTAEPGLELKVMVALDPETRAVRRLEVERAAVGQTWLTGAVDLTGPVPAFLVSDGVLDLEPVLKYRKTLPKDDPDTLPALTIDAGLRAVRMGERRVLERVSASLGRTNTHWRTALIRGTVQGGPPLSLTLGPSGEERAFSLVTEDGGAALRGLDVIDSLGGGALRVEGVIDDAGLARGRIDMTDFRLTQAPVLARLLSVAGLTGILDALAGPGIGFSVLRAPFVYKDPDLVLKDARAYGMALGLSARGTINLETDTLALEGTLAPAYAINRLVGQIPLVGQALVGGEGEGLIGVTYSVNGTLDDPRVGVNPLSALTPGFLRGIFGLFEGPAQQTAEPPLGGGQ